jgi:hypothetical protein
LAYIVPIVDHVLRKGSGRGIQAIVVYPMNALANSQDEELSKFLKKGYPEGQSPVRFARYTGQEKGDVREALRRDPPDILLTNYMMLELLLTHSDDRGVALGAGSGTNLYGVGFGAVCTRLWLGRSAIPLGRGASLPEPLRASRVLKKSLAARL